MKTLRPLSVLMAAFLLSACSIVGQGGPSQSAPVAMYPVAMGTGVEVGKLGKYKREELYEYLKGFSEDEIELFVSSFLNCFDWKAKLIATLQAHGYDEVTPLMMNEFFPEDMKETRIYKYLLDTEGDMEILAMVIEYGILKNPENEQAWACIDFFYPTDEEECPYTPFIPYYLSQTELWPRPICAFYRELDAIYAKDELNYDEWNALLWESLRRKYLGRP